MTGFGPGVVAVGADKETGRIEKVKAATWTATAED